MHNARSEGAEVTPRRGQGRPRDEEKAAAILKAARELFYELGFDAVTMEGVAAKAGVSKVTVYARHGNKTHLLEAVIEAERERALREVDRAAEQAGDLRTRLVSFGTAVLQATLDPQSLALDRLITAQAVRHRAMAQKYFEAGPLHRRRRLAQILSEAGERGEVKVADADRVANDLMALWSDPRNLAVMSGVDPSLDGAGVKAHVEHGVDVVLAYLRAAG